LSTAEVEAVGKEAEVDELRERFRKVVRGAGYQGDKIVEEYFPRYIAGNRAEFIAMLVDYETHNYDPD
jgi:truncated hemoglobin YjbI